MTAKWEDATTRTCDAYRAMLARGVPRDGVVAALAMQEGCSRNAIRCRLKRGGINYNAWTPPVGTNDGAIDTRAGDKTERQQAENASRYFVNRLRPLFERVALRGGISLEEATKLVVNSAVRP